MPYEKQYYPERVIMLKALRKAAGYEGDRPHMDASRGQLDAAAEFLRKMADVLESMNGGSCYWVRD